MSQADIGLIGLAVMGQNLALNIADHGFTISVYNRTAATTEAFIAGTAKGKSVIGTKTISEFIQSLKRPRKVMILVKAGEAVDAVINEIKPFLEKGDIIIDGGNSLYTDSNRREKELRDQGFIFIGCGVSGGEVGARHGPSLMPGGNKEGWPHIKPIFQSICAQVDGLPCCDWVGDGGSGHYVKMVHNGIEYADMQLICEAHYYLSKVLHVTCDDQSEVFKEWNKTFLNSYLIEITAEILKFKDENNEPLIEKILDIAGQKGTGKWTAINALELGAPVTLIDESVNVRFMSALKEQRQKAENLFNFRKDLQAIGGRMTPFVVKDYTEALQSAVYVAKMISYTQGFMMFRMAMQEYKWDLNLGAIAMMWRGGCIIRSGFLHNIKKAYDNNPNLECLLFDDYFAQEIKRHQRVTRKLMSSAISGGFSLPVISNALSFLDGFCTGESSSNLIQAMRDYFGGHQFERKDRPRGEFFHVDWAGTGGAVSSNPYNV